MKKIITYNNYSYYIGNDNGNLFYNIVPSDQLPPNGGHSKEWILAVKKVPDLFEVTPSEISKLKKAKKELLTDEKATFTSNARNYKLLADIAEKYKVSNQLLYNSIEI